MEEISQDPWLREYNSLLQESNDIYRRAAKSLGVPECTLWILYALRVEGRPMTQKTLCQLTQQPKQTVHSALKNLQAEGCIRLSAGSDRRTREISLTEEGARLAGRTADRIARAEIQALNSLEQEEREAYLRASRKLNRLLRLKFAQIPQEEKETI